MLSVGLIPENELAKKAGVALDPVTGGPIVDDQFQTSVPGIFCAGNALQVHDLVDYASLEAEKAGVSAATYADTGKITESTTRVVAGEGIRYVVPQGLSGDEAVDFSMRVTSPDRDRYVVFRRDGQVIRRMKQALLEPSAMIRIRVRADRLKNPNGDLTVEVGG
jgi:hypothetical protein